MVATPTTPTGSLHLARALGREDEVTERVLRAWYTEGEAIGDPETLVRLGIEAGLSEDAVRELLAGDDYGIDVRTDLALASQIGITAVPTFVLDQKYGVSGAQPVEVMLTASARCGSCRAPSRSRSRMPAAAAAGAVAVRVDPDLSDAPPRTRRPAAADAARADVAGSAGPPPRIRPAASR